jgi:putative sugar O-methyltransferase
MKVNADSRDVAAYSAMLEDNRSAATVYQAGAFWDEINRDFSDLIWAGALADLRNQYFSRRFSAWDPRDRVAYRCLLRLYQQKLRSKDRTGFLERESDPQEGGADDQEIVSGQRVSLDFLQSVDEAFLIRDALHLAGRSEEPRLVVELGAGYGRLAYVMRRMYPNCTYVICDLPEALICANSWLSRVLPGQVVPYEESRKALTLSREALLARPCWTLGTHQLEALAGNAVDVFVNIYSFAEMPLSTIEHYFRHIDRVTNGILFIKQRKREENAKDSVTVIVDTYPVPSSWRVLFHQDTTLYESFFEAAWDTRERP